MATAPLESSEQVASDLVHALCKTAGLNDFFEHALPRIAALFGSRRAVLVDYHENTNHFDLLHFVGYEKQARFDLQRELLSNDVQRALSERGPYVSAEDAKRVYLPLYFTTTLEALIVLEADSAVELTPRQRQIAEVISKFIGLLMSSMRLSINQPPVVDMNDLQRARQIQLTYLPSENLETDRYEVYGYNRSSALVGGDYFDYFRLRDRSIQCVLADASGHGLSAALIMSTFRGLLHAAIADTRDCSELFNMLNRTVYSGSNVVQYLTGVYLDFDERHNRLKYANAGHFDPAVIRNDGRLERLAGGGPPLGMFKNSKYPEADTEVRPGDLLVLFTDGLADLRNPAGDFFGEEGILGAVQDQRRRPLNEIASVLLKEGLTFAGSVQPEDDLTLFMMRFR